MPNFYELPKLPYDYKDLEPFLSEKQLKIHHTKHHQGYVDKSNKILKEIEEYRKENKKIDIKSKLKNLSFTIGGHILHSLFWPSLSKCGGEKPVGKLAQEIEKEFKSFKRFKEEFSQAAKTVEGSGWAALVRCKKTNRLLIMQIEKHNVNIFPGFNILLVLDVWEHAYYLDYKNKRLEYIENFWNFVNWEEINKRFEKI